MHSFAKFLYFFRTDYGWIPILCSKSLSVILNLSRDFLCVTLRCVVWLILACVIKMILHYMSWYLLLVVYHKAIRDKIPELIKSSGKSCHTRTLTDSEFLAALERKLTEEIHEYNESRSVEELADILEVVFRIADLKGTPVDSLEAIRKEKSNKCGKFSKNLFLISVQGDDS